MTTTKEITITATSGGYYGGNTAQISVNGKEIGFNNYRQGINVAVFEETTGLPLFCTNFDTLISPENGDTFADLINSLPEGRIVALAVQSDTVPTPLSDKIKQACHGIGSAEVDQLQRAQSWAVVGIKGHQPGTAHESISWLETSSSYILEVEAVKSINNFVVEAISKPLTAAGKGAAQILLNGTLQTPEGGYKDGFNLMVFDRQDGQIKTSGSFNPSNASELDELVETLQELEAGEIVAIATQDYFGTQIYQSLKKACVGIGATMLGDLKQGGTWAIVGYKGAKPGQAVENLGIAWGGYYGGQGVAVKYWSGATEPVKKGLKVGQKLFLSDASAYFGSGLGIDGDYALVGDHDKNNAYMYRWHDGQWQIQQQLLPKGQQGGNFGISVDVSGNLAIVGQHYASVSGKSQCGAAHIYELKGGQWQHQQMLQPSDLKASDYFGLSVAIDGKKAIVGANHADAPGKQNCGAAYIFHLEDGKWVQKAKLQPLDLGADDSFGQSVAIDDNTAIVGAYQADAQGKTNCGAAYIFHWENGQWQQQHKLQPLDLGINDLFGLSVAVAGNLAIVGAVYAEVAGKTGAGAAYIYQLQDGMWQLHQKIQATDPNALDYFAHSVGIGGNVAVVGAYGADASGKKECGAAYMFQLVNGKWEQKQKLQPDDLAVKGNWGYTTSFDGRRAIIGGNGYNLSPKIGFAYICNVTVEE